MQKQERAGMPAAIAVSSNKALHSNAAGELKQ